MDHGCSPSNFANYFEFLESLLASSGYRAFELCAFIVIFTLCFRKLSYLKSDPRICQTAKFHVKMENLEFGTKNALHGYFWAVILNNSCHILNQHSRICQKQNFCQI